jgi:hypothetical protein
VKVPLKVEHVRIQRELVLAEPCGSADLFIVRSIPAFAYGVAYGDLIELLDEASGDFCVVRHCGQITLRVFTLGGLETPAIRTLIENAITLKGLYEVGKASVDSDQRSLLLISLDISLGFDAIERLISGIKTEGDQWEYGNVYDESGLEIGWWDSREKQDQAT